MNKVLKLGLGGTGLMLVGLFFFGLSIANNESDFPGLAFACMLVGAGVGPVALTLYFLNRSALHKVQREKGIGLSGNTTDAKTPSPAATTKKVTHPEDEELNGAVQEIEKTIRERNDPQFPMITLTVHRQSEDTASVMICLPQDRAKVDPAEDVCILWLYPNNKGLSYAAAESLLLNHLKPLGYKLSKPSHKYSRDGGPSYHHWIAKKGTIESEPAVIEASRVLTEHAAHVHAVSYSPDGTKLASGAGSYGDRDNTVRLWDAITGQQLRVMTQHEDEISCLCFSPDGKVLLSGEEILIAWDVATGDLLWGTRDKTGSRCVSVCYSPDGRTMACGFANGVIRIWTAEKGTHLHTLEGHTKGVKCVKYSPDGKTLASSSFDQTIRLWDTATGRQLRVIQGHRDAVRSITYSPDGKTLASGSDDRTIGLWDTESGQQLQFLEGHDGEVISVCYSPNGKTLASASGDKTIRVWDTITGKQQYVLKGHTLAVLALSFSPDGSTLASASSDKTVRLWRVGIANGGERHAGQKNNSESTETDLRGT